MRQSHDPAVIMDLTVLIRDDGLGLWSARRRKTGGGQPRNSDR
ncbi:MAG: hypothetical protein ABJ360_02390 [Roseobacter sp.]